MPIKRKLLAISIALCVVGPALAAEPALIPNPARMEMKDGEFPLKAGATLFVPANDPAALGAAKRLAGFVQSTCRLPLKVQVGAARDGAIALTRASATHAVTMLGEEGYELDASPKQIELVARTDAGLQHGTSTLWQLLCPGKTAAKSVPALRIQDTPRFGWRGMMLDSARHFQSADFVRRYIDWMALHKLNVFHWHLTDDQAWRLEIKKYPKLTSIGAWRVPAGDAPRKNIDPKTGKPRLYGGFYTQAQVRQIVAYAAERGITVVPEIEMPGHATAAVVAYPHLAATPTPPKEMSSDWGIFPNAFNLEEPTFAFLEDVLTEVMALFPGKYIHVGGDEVTTAQWKASPTAQARMKELGITDPAQLQTYFTQRIGKFLEARGRRLVGWDEILTPGMPASAVVMSWRGLDGALGAAAKGHDTILAPAPTLYFDNWAVKGRGEPPARGNVVSLETVYRFEPMPEKIAPDRRKHVLGLQAQLWTEHIRTEERAAYMTFPRAAAVAELGWSSPERREWNSFRRRLQVQADRYDALKIPYARAALADAASGQKPLLRRSSQELKLCSEHIALNLEDDAPVNGPRTAYFVDVQSPCWIYEQAPLDAVKAVSASVGQLPFNFQIGDDVKKVTFPPPTTPEGELEVRLGADCKGEVIARLPVKPAVKSDAVTKLPRASIAPRTGNHDLCLRFAQRFVQPEKDPLWVIESFELVK